MRLDLLERASRKTFLVNYSSEHKWFYMSEMQPDEALLLKCFDSASLATSPKEGIASLTPHTAFVDKKYEGADVPPRESIEIRALVYTDA